MTGGHLAWRVAGIATALAAALALRWATAVEVRAAPADASLVRLSWSARPEFLERCRRLSDAELAERPAHMRMRLSCEGKFARYLLRVTVNGVAIATDTVRGGGLRHDRPLHVFREYGTPAGRLHLQVELSRLDSAGADPTAATEGSEPESADTLLAGRAAREVDERQRRAGEAILPRLVLDTLLPLPPRRVVLVTYDEAKRQLVARTER